jgi:hypothetical protein
MSHNEAITDRKSFQHIGPSDDDLALFRWEDDGGSVTSSTKNDGSEEEHIGEANEFCHTA